MKMLDISFSKRFPLTVFKSHQVETYLEWSSEAVVLLGVEDFKPKENSGITEGFRPKENSDPLNGTAGFKALLEK